MQTFLPYRDFTKSARCLDRARLGKQRWETMQILTILINDTPLSGWRNHPATLMWEGYHYALAWYGMVVCNEWLLRGYEDNLYFKFSRIFRRRMFDQETWLPPAPPFLGRVEFHKSHQSNLMRKDPKHYMPHFGDVPDNLPYIWPVRKIDGKIVHRYS